MRICFLVYSTGISGGTRAIFEIGQRLNTKFPVHYLALGGIRHEWFQFSGSTSNFLYIEPKLNIPLLRKASLSGVCEEFFRHIHLPYKIDKVRFLAENIPPNHDVYIATYYPTAFSLFLSAVKGKKIFFMQDTPELVFQNDGASGLKLFNVVLTLPFDYILCNSNYSKTILEKRNPNAKISVLKVGIDNSIFKLDVKNEKKYSVMIILKENKVKGGIMAIETLNIVSRSIPLHVLIVSTKKDLKAIFSKIKPNFRYSVKFNVDSRKIACLYATSNLFLFTSYIESFGLPPLEAMACGTPVVTTDCVGVRDYAINGFNSLIVPPGDCHVAAKMVCNVLTDERLSLNLIKGGLTTAKEWSWSKIVDQLEKTLIEVLGKF